MRTISTGGQAEPDALLAIFRLTAPASSPIAFSPDSQVVASTGESGIIRLWSVADGSALAELTPFDLHVEQGGELPPVLALAFSTDGRRLYTGTTNVLISVWGIGPG